MRATTFIALLRGINISGRHPVPMAELRALPEALGGTDVRTYVNSGNLVLRSGAAPTPPEYVASNPFAAGSGHESRLVMLALPKRAPAADAVARLQERAAAGEVNRGRRRRHLDLLRRRLRRIATHPRAPGPGRRFPGDHAELADRARPRAANLLRANAPCSGRVRLANSLSAP